MEARPCGGLLQKLPWALSPRIGKVHWRSIKRIKVDLDAQCLPYRDARRVQAFLDRKLLTMHLLLKIQALAG